MTALPGRGTRKVIGYVVGLVVGIAAMIVVWKLMFASVYAASAREGYGTRVWLILAFVGLVLGSSASSFTFWLLERGAKRAHDARIPAARVVSGTDHPKP
jgi:uncharacterized membrane protein YwzB